MSVLQDAPEKHFARIGCFRVFSHPQILLSCQQKRRLLCYHCQGQLTWEVTSSNWCALPRRKLPNEVQVRYPEVCSSLWWCSANFGDRKSNCTLCQSQGHCWWSTIKASASGVVTFERSKTSVIKIHQREGGITAQCSRQVLISPALQWSTVVSPFYVKGHLSSAQFSATTNFEVLPRSVTLIILKSIGGLPIFHSPAETCSSWKLRKRGRFSYQQRLPKVTPTSHQR